MPFTVARDHEAAERWQRREQRQDEAREAFGVRRARRPFNPDDYLAEGGKAYWQMSAQEKSAARIEHAKRVLKRNPTNYILKNRIRRMEKTHATRSLLGWGWLEEHPEHPLSPAHQDWLKYGPKQQL